MPLALALALTALLPLLTALPQPQEERCRACSQVSARFCCRFFALCCAEVPQCRPNSLPSDTKNVTSGGKIPCSVNAQSPQEMHVGRLT